MGFIVTNLRRSPRQVVKFYNGRGTAEQWIKQGNNAVKWTRLSCHDFVDKQVRLSRCTSGLREKLIKIGAKVVTHARYVIFQMAEVAVPKRLFRAILTRIRRLRLPEPVPG